MPPHAIVASGLVVRYGEVTAVDGLDLSADAGEVVAVLGRNGAGKTSTVEALEGYRRASAGSVRVLDLDPQDPGQRAALTRRVGVMLQRGGVYPAMSPAEAARLWASYYDDPLDPEGVLSRVGLSGAVAHTPWRRLSGGEQQRLSLALALIGRPDVVFLDEPTAGVDPHGRVAIRAVVGELRAEGVCVVLTTHELEEAERLADRIVIVKAGRVVAAGTPAELVAGGGSLRFRAAAGLDTAGLGARLGARVVATGTGEYLVEAPASPATVAALTSWLADRDLALADLRAGDRLEDVFLRLTEAGVAGGGAADAGAAGGAATPGPAAAERPHRRRLRRTLGAFLGLRERKTHPKRSEPG